MKIWRIILFRDCEINNCQHEVQVPFLGETRRFTDCYRDATQYLGAP